jgi:hypothetical protein
MATITQTNVGKGGGAKNITLTTLTSSDTFSYQQGAGQVLILFNTTGSPVTATITGSAATTISPSGFGGTVSVASGKAVTVPANGMTLLNLDDISAFLKGTITVTGGTGLEAAVHVLQ